jgi:vacuolar-type H+-ATPase subunit E/Vma4
MATIKQALLQQIEIAEKEIADIHAYIETEQEAIADKYASEVVERKQRIKAMQSMISLYDKHNVLLDTISVTTVVEAPKKA